MVVGGKIWRVGCCCICVLVWSLLLMVVLIVVVMFIWLVCFFIDMIWVI